MMTRERRIAFDDACKMASRNSAARITLSTAAASGLREYLIELEGIIQGIPVQNINSTLYNRIQKVRSIFYNKEADDE